MGRAENTRRVNGFEIRQNLNAQGTRAALRRPLPGLRQQRAPLKSQTVLSDQIDYRPRLPCAQHAQCRNYLSGNRPSGLGVIGQGDSTRELKASLLSLTAMMMTGFTGLCWPSKLMWPETAEKDIFWASQAVSCEALVHQKVWRDEDQRREKLAFTSARTAIWPRRRGVSSSGADEPLLPATFCTTFCVHCA